MADTPTRATRFSAAQFRTAQYRAEHFSAGAETFGAVLSRVTPDEVITRNVYNALK